MNTNQDMTNSEEPLALQKQFDAALCDLRSAIAVVTAMNHAVGLDEATRNSAMSVVVRALNEAYHAIDLAIARFRNEALKQGVIPITPHGFATGVIRPGRAPGAAE